VPESEEFSRFLRKPSRVELGAIEADTAANPFIMQKFKQAILDDYDTSVLVKGKQGRMEVDPVAFEAWYAETKGTIERFFTPEEMLHVNRPGGIYHVVQRQARNLQQSGEQINKIIDIDLGTKSLLKEENQRALWNQISGLNGGQQRQLFRLLDNVPGVPRGELGDQVRNIVRQEMQEDLLSKTKGKNVEGFNKWLNVVVPPKGGGIIRNLWPAEASEYIASLKLLRHTLQRRTDRGMVVGRGADVNPTGLAATRVIFGPLSRIQRGISALRRGQVRGGAAKASSLVSDPEALKLFQGIYVHRVASVDVARVVQDLGGWDLFPVDITEYIPGFPEGREGEEFDANNPEHRQAVSDYVMDKLALDPSIEPEATPPKQRFNFRYEN